ncbi:MAG: glycosyltransferase, partial [Flavobacteriales bacterium]|nr:glycosyltransferase [Flavobacteriales bacterium]
VLKQLLLEYEDADVFCLFNFFDENQRSEILLGRKTRSTFIERIPFSQRFYRYLVPIFFKAIEKLDLSEYDIIISSSHAVAKGVRKREGQIHFCYCHTPMRYVWNMKKTYLRQIPERFRKLATAQFNRIKEWDYNSSKRVDYFIANSKFVSNRIKNNYQKESIVINPPVDTEFFCPPRENATTPEKDPYYLVVSRMVHYKRTELIVEAFGEMLGKKLIVIGAGPQLSALKETATSNVKFLNFQTSERILEYMQFAEAAIFCAIEDFGITCLEVQACGTPVIAYDYGGYKETVKNGETGILFEQQSVISIIEGVNEFISLKEKFDSSVIRENSLDFGEDRFRAQIRELVNARMLEHDG